MRWDGGGESERVLYVEEGIVGHGQSGKETEDEERGRCAMANGREGHIAVTGERNKTWICSAIGDREIRQGRHMLLFARGI